MHEHSNEWIPWHWHPWQLVCQATRSHLVFPTLRIFQMNCMEFFKKNFFPFLKISWSIALYYIILFHESWWHWQNLLLDISKLIAFLVSICRWLHIKINFIFANTIGIIWLKNTLTCFMPKDLDPPLMPPSSFHVCFTSNTCETRRSHLNKR